MKLTRGTDMKKRLTKGFTIVEVLIATAILALFVSMAVVGTSALFGTGEEMMAASKAAVLGSDVMKVVTNEIRFGEGFPTLDITEREEIDPNNPGEMITIKECTPKKGETSLSYNSTAYGEGSVMKLGEGDKQGQLVVISKTKTFYPLSAAAYGEIYIEAIIFDIEGTVIDGNVQHKITCTVKITDGEKTLWQQSATIVPLYQKAIG